MDKYLGRRLDGRYELREIIGVGGMAYVYRAYDTIDDRIVAVKILKDEYLHNEEFSRRFKNESKAIAILSHKNIVRVNDVSFSDSLQYIVMEYIDGITLKEYIEQQKVLQWKEVVHFIVQILQALQHAHDKGIVHQDVKPQNIMLLSDGTIKVTDFGIARFSRVASQQSEQGDKAIGSVHYISPEQARAEITDEKSDIYSVGVMMYEMLTGKLPFESDNAVSVAIMQMQSLAERPTSINPDIPEGLEEITLKAMQKDPAKRYQSAAEMLYDIDEFKNNPSIRFEYKYFSGADDPSHYEEAFNRIRKHDKSDPVIRTSRSKMYNDKKEDNRKSLPIIPILAGIAGAFVLVLLLVMGVYFTTELLAPANNGTQNITVPDFVGKDFEVELANDPAIARNFTIQINEEYSDKPANTVLKQYPLPGKEVKLRAELILYISRGAQLVEVPAFDAGENRETASARLRAAGFTVKEITANSDKIPSGGVVRVDPPKGTMLEKGSTVTLYVSIGAEPINNVAVPSVVGRAQEDAIKRLTDKGFVVKTEKIVRVNHPTYSAGVVLSQLPESGTEVAPDSEIVLTVSSGYKDVNLDVNLPQVEKNIDLDVYIDAKLWYSQDGIDPESTSSMEFQLKEQKAKYTVTVELSEAGKKKFKTYAIFVINGETGTIVSSDYRSFAVATTTTKATTTTTKKTKPEKTTTTTEVEEETTVRGTTTTGEPVYIPTTTTRTKDKTTTTTMVENEEIDDGRIDEE